MKRPLTPEPLHKVTRIFRPIRFICGETEGDLRLDCARLLWATRKVQRWARRSFHLLADKLTRTGITNLRELRFGFLVQYGFIRIRMYYKKFADVLMNIPVLRLRSRSFALYNLPP